MTTLGANVSLIEHSIRYSETLDDYIVTVDYALPLTYRAAQVPVCGEAYPGDTAPWGYTVLNHESFKTMERTGGNLRERFDLKLVDTRTVALGPYVTRVTYAKPKVPFDSGNAALKEVYRRFETGRRQSLNIPRYFGTRVFLVVDNDAENVVNTALPDRTPMTASGSWSVALLREKTIERNWRVGIARVEALYDSTSRIGEVLAIGHGILEADFSSVWMPNNYEVEPGHRIDEPFTNPFGNIVGRRRWKRIQGNAGIPLVTIDLKIRVLLTESNLSALVPLAGRINDAGCPNILGAPKNTLWFNKFNMRQREYGQSNLYDCTIYLACNPDGWDKVSEAELQEFVPFTLPILADDRETDTGQKHLTWSWDAVPDTDTKKSLLHNEAGFSVINGYLG